MLLTRLFRLVALLALLLAPSGMLGSHAALATPQQPTAMSMGHCDEQQAPQDHHKQSMIDCAIACSAMAAMDAFLPPPPRLMPVEFQAAALPEIEGTRPQAATPPPRAV